MKPSEKQQKIYDTWVNEDSNILVQAVAGCLAYDTEILMYNSSRKKVQDIIVGDILMGDDATPRNVLSLCRGQEQMYEIIPSEGDSFICNENHILTLWCIRTEKLIDISLLEFISKWELYQQLADNTYTFYSLQRNSILRLNNIKKVHNISRTKFSIEKRNIDNYYGFNLDGNNRFLLGDFTITHNSGKSTTLLELGKLSTHKSCLYLAFNKTIQLELEEKIKQNNMNHCSALTLHGLGLSMITKVKNVEVNDGKVYNLMYEIISKNKWLYKLKSDTRNELDFLRYALIDCNNISRLYLTSDLDEIEKYGFIMGKVFSYDILTQIEKDKLFQKYRKIFPSDEEVINSPEYNAEYQSINRRKFIVLWNKLYELREESYNEEKIIIDFLDMIYLPVIKNVPVPTQYQYMFVDECQDLSYLQQKFIDKLLIEGEIEKYSAFGDKNQCQPSGTKILCANGEEKNIEDIEIGDELVTYNIKNCHFHGLKSINPNTIPKKVINKKSQNYNGTLFTITTENNEKSTYTYNHKCYVSLLHKNYLHNKFALYIMEKKGKFRIGFVETFSKSQTTAFGVSQRARSENADKFWVLEIYNSRKEAYLNEQLLSFKYGIPQTVFKDNNKSTFMSQSLLDIFWEKMDSEILFENTCNLLTIFNKKYEYPLWTRVKNSHGGQGNSWKLTSEAMFKTQACNILPSIMKMCIFDKDNLRPNRQTVIKRTFSNIKKVEVDVVFGHTVHCLEVEDNHNYVADNILTSNSIYLFAGSFSKSFDMFKDRDNVIELPLDINYRCSTNIIAYANEVYNNLLPFKTSEGVVKHIKEADYTKREDNLYRLEDIVRNIDDDCLIICRNTKPLIQLYFNLLSVNRTPSFVGNDILNSVVNFLKPYKKDTVKTFKEELRDNLKLLVAKKDNSDRDRLEYLLTKSNNETFTLIQNRLKYTDNLLIDNIITDLKLKLSRKGDIKLCTIHKSKGLEHDTVYLLNENLIPSKFALTEEALVQENNIKYVARTRAKNNLYLLNLKEEEKD